jgi:RNA polymerase sigma-70 factor (ECF subfamily)
MNAITAHAASSSPDVDRLYRDYGAAVGRWANQMARSITDAEDIVQEVFLIAHRRRSHLAALRNPASWLYRIAENVARHLWRSRRRRRLSSIAVEELTDLANHPPTPLDVLEGRRRLAQLDRALATLQEGDRRLLLRQEVRAVAAPRVARAAMNAQTARVRRHRARLRVARCLRELEVIHEC